MLENKHSTRKVITASGASLSIISETLHLKEKMQRYKNEGVESQKVFYSSQHAHALIQGACVTSSCT
jgi:hypothetical protein